MNLDEYNFEKVIPRFKATVVKFDVIYPYGDKHNAYAALAEELAHNQDLLFAQVGVKDYGDRENEALAKRFDVKDKADIPAVVLFLGGVDQVVAFPKENDFTISNLRNFIRDNVNVYIGLPGCLKEYDEIAVGFAKSDDKEERLKEAERLKETLKSDVSDSRLFLEVEVDSCLLQEEKNSASAYIKFMKKIIEKGAGFVKNEVERLSKIVREGKVNDKKKQELSNHLNILHSFSVSTKRDEL